MAAAVAVVAAPRAKLRRRRCADEEERFLSSSIVVPGGSLQLKHRFTDKVDGASALIAMSPGISKFAICLLNL